MKPPKNCYVVLIYTKSSRMWHQTVIKGTVKDAARFIEKNANFEVVRSFRRYPKGGYWECSKWGKVMWANISTPTFMMVPKRENTEVYRIDRRYADMLAGTSTNAPDEEVLKEWTEYLAQDGYVYSHTNSEEVYRGFCALTGIEGMLREVVFKKI